MPTEPDLWSSNFHPISLHRSIKHIASDSKSIKDSLNFMAKYIVNKKVNSSNANDLSDFNGMNGSIWNFISLVYQANWDSFYTDNKTMTLRTKISSKFTLRIAPSNNKGNKNMTKHVPVTIKKVSPPLSLPAKSKNEVNTISKYFQNKKQLGEPKKPATSYAQALKPSANTSKIIKIKETFPSLNAKKIDQVNNIIKGNLKPKPRIQMMTKGPSRKQVIIPISNENNNIFMKNSATHVTNINRQLRNAKSEILVDYIQSDPLGISVVTNKISQQSDYQIIEHYIKNSSDINSLQVDELHLLQSKSYLKIISIHFFLCGNS